MRKERMETLSSFEQRRVWANECFTKALWEIEYVDKFKSLSWRGRAWERAWYYSDVIEMILNDFKLGKRYERMVEFIREELQKRRNVADAWYELRSWA